jgi:hypothetical protein
MSEIDISRRRPYGPKGLPQFIPQTEKQRKEFLKYKRDREKTYNSSYEVKRGYTLINRKKGQIFTSLGKQSSVQEIFSTKLIEVEVLDEDDFNYVRQKRPQRTIKKKLTLAAILSKNSSLKAQALKSPNINKDESAALITSILSHNQEDIPQDVILSMQETMQNINSDNFINVPHTLVDKTDVKKQGKGQTVAAVLNEHRDESPQDFVKLGIELNKAVSELGNDSIDLVNLTIVPVEQAQQMKEEGRDNFLEEEEEVEEQPFFSASTPPERQKVDIYGKTKSIIQKRRDVNPYAPVASRTRQSLQLRRPPPAPPISSRTRQSLQLRRPAPAAFSSPIFDSDSDSV